MNEKEKRIIERALQKIRENKTTKKQAKKMLDIVLWCDHWQLCYFDYSDYIKELQKGSLESEIENLIHFIKEGFDVVEIKDDTKLLKMFKSIFLIDARKKDTQDNYTNYKLYVKSIKKLLQE